MTPRALPLLGALVLGCFASAPTLETDTSVATESADSTGAPMCAADEVALPAVPDGWDGPAWVAIGDAGAPPTICPEATTADTMFLAMPDSPACVCACDVEDACGTTYSIGDACDMGLAMQGPLGLCEDLAAPSTAIDLSVTPGSATCVATPQPFGGAATPVQVCSLVGVGDGCAMVQTGFVGPCITGDADACPEGFGELVADATAFACEPCAPCDAETYCNGVPFDLFEQADCAGMPSSSVEPGANCAPTGAPALSIRASGRARLDNGCEATGASVRQRRICCVTE